MKLIDAMHALKHAPNIHFYKTRYRAFAQKTLQTAFYVTYDWNIPRSFDIISLY